MSTPETVYFGAALPFEHDFRPDRASSPSRYGDKPVMGVHIVLDEDLREASLVGRRWLAEYHGVCPTTRRRSYEEVPFTRFNNTVVAWQPLLICSAVHSCFLSGAQTGAFLYCYTVPTCVQELANWKPMKAIQVVIIL